MNAEIEQDVVEKRPAGEELVPVEDVDISSLSENDAENPDGFDIEEEKTVNNDPETDVVEKPDAESTVDWEYVAKKERYKRQKKEERIQELEKAQAQPAQQEVALVKPKRPKLYDAEISGDEDKLDVAMDKYEDETFDFRERQRDRKIEFEAVKVKVDDYQDRIASYSAKNPAYATAFEDAGKPVFPKHVDDALMESQIGPEIEHHLFENFEDLSAIMKSSPYQAYEKIVEIKNSIAASKTAKGAKINRKTSAASAPANRETGGGGSHSSTALMEGYTMS